MSLVLALWATGCRQKSLDSIFAEANALDDHSDPAALRKVEAGLGAAEARHSSEWIWKFRCLLASIQIKQGIAKEALTTLASMESPPTPHLLAEQKSLQGLAYTNVHNYPEAERLLLSARAIAEHLDDRRLIDQIDINYSALLDYTGRFDEADKILHHVIEDARHRGLQSQEAQAANNLGYLNQEHLRYEEAIPLLQNAVDAFSRQRDAFWEAKATGNLGWPYLYLGDLDSALAHFEEGAAKAAKIHNTTDQAASLNGQAEVLLRQHKYAEASRSSQRARDLAHRAGDTAHETDALDDLAEGSLARQDWNAALRFNDESRALKKKRGDLGGLADNDEVDARIAAGKKDFARAEELLRAVLASKREIDPSTILNAHADLAGLYASRGKIAHAETEFRASIAFSEAQRSHLEIDQNKLTYLSSLSRFYQAYVSFLVDCHQEKKALEIADASRARLLAEKLIAEPRSRTAADFQNLAKTSGSVLLSYWLAPEKSYLWIVNGKATSTVELAGEDELTPVVQKYQAFLEQEQGDPIASKNQESVKLWQMLVQPAAKLIPKGSEVILVPDGILHSLNFETLLATDPSLHYWIEDAAISIAPSLSLLFSSGTPEAKPSLLLIGAPETPGPDFPKLPHAVDEIRKVGAHFASTTRVYAGAAAVPAVYRNASPGQFRMIHFATHSLPNRKSPLDSALILSPAADVYKLYAREIAKVPIHAELVTISACKSAGAKIYSGEGQVGLAWAFLQAGAHHVIAGLWDVDDTYTPDLMDDLYSEIEKGSSPAHALRHAKIAMIRSLAPKHKPYYWGPFLTFTGSYR